MRGAGGPLLCIGDLLSDVGKDESSNPISPSPAPSPLSCSPAASVFTMVHSSSGLPKIFQEDYNKLNEALAEGDHSWTALTLELCSSLEMANTMVQSTNTNSRLLLEKIGELDEIIKRGDTAVATAKALCVSSSCTDIHSFGRDTLK